MGKTVNTQDYLDNLNGLANLEQHLLNGTRHFWRADELTLIQQPDELLSQLLDNNVLIDTFKNVQLRRKNPEAFLLIGDRPLTESEIRYGQSLQPLAQAALHG